MQDRLTRFERAFGRLILHKAFIGSYLVGAIILFTVTASFGPVGARSDLLFGVTLAFIGGYFLLLGVYLGTQAVSDFLSSMHGPAVVAATFSVALLFFSGVCEVAAYHLFFRAAGTTR